MLLPFLLVVHTVLDQPIKLRAFLPFLSGTWRRCRHGHPGQRCQKPSPDSHPPGYVNGQVSLHRLIGSFFGERQKVAVHVAALFQIILGQCRVRHGVFVQRLLLGIRQLGGCGFCGLLAGLFCKVSIIDRRSILDGLAAHSQSSQIWLTAAERPSPAHPAGRRPTASWLTHRRGVVPTGITRLDMKIGGIVQHAAASRYSALAEKLLLPGLFLRSLLGCLHRLQVCGQVNAALLADFL